MLGDVWVTVAALESDGQIDASTEDWQPAQIQQVMKSVTDGLAWWENLLTRYSSRQQLNFHLDFSRLFQPIATPYEPISRPSEDVGLWIDDFLDHEGANSPADFQVDIRQFNHSQRLAHQTDWAFTLLIVDSARDADGFFDADGEFAGAFAFPGGQFAVIPSTRPAATIAHEVGHIFWAMDEYAGSETYFDRRGYYNTQNVNAYDQNPDPKSRQLSIMDRAGAGYAANAISDSARRSIGWQDSDGDGLFDVLDVDLKLTAAVISQPDTHTLTVSGQAAAQALPNLNSSGTGHDITLNRVRRIEYRVDGGHWALAQQFDQPQADFRVSIGPLPTGRSTVELRAVDDRWGVSSNIWTTQVDFARTAAERRLDVNADGRISPVDALLVINQLNRPLAAGRPTSTTSASLVADTNGDGVVSPIDALLVMQYLGRQGGMAVRAEVLPVVSQTVKPGGNTVDPAATDVLMRALGEGGNDAAGEQVSSRPRTDREFAAGRTRRVSSGLLGQATASRSSPRHSRTADHSPPQGRALAGRRLDSPGG